MPRKAARARRDPATESFNQGRAIVSLHPLFAPMMSDAFVRREVDSRCPPDAWAAVTGGGVVHVHPTRRGEPEEWAYVLAHCLLHLGFGHFVALKLDRRKLERLAEWNAACDLFIARFLADLKLGRIPEAYVCPMELADGPEERLFLQFCERGIPFKSVADMLPVTRPANDWRAKIDWPALLSEGLTAAIAGAVNVAGGVQTSLTTDDRRRTRSQQARQWFISSYPLLGALAAAFEIVEDPLVCQRLGISVAAVDMESREIFINPAAGLDDHELRFVMAHELLHVALRHDVRCRGRDFFLFNVACDYVINGWLVEMGLGSLPTGGCLYDPTLKGESAESIYDRLVTDLRRARKLATLRGIGLGDILQRPRDGHYLDGVDLDEFCRRCLAQGLLYHQQYGRGYLPAALIEEIRALSQPPIPWDVELAQWFDQHFAPLEQMRSYARPSRRQSATPDIPRPRWVPSPTAEDGRTFGVVLDTSGSMDRTLLAKALGAIGSYSLAHDVPAVRVVFCDAATYDQGYLSPDAVAGRVRVKGRGGTILQPAIDLLESAENFPDDGPLLIITDGWCDKLRIRRDHAFLLPVGRDLPFAPRGKVFRLQ